MVPHFSHLEASDSTTALTNAAQKGHQEVVEELLCVGQAGIGRSAALFSAPHRPQELLDRGPRSWPRSTPAACRVCFHQYPEGFDGPMDSVPMDCRWMAHYH